MNQRVSHLERLYETINSVEHEETEILRAMAEAIIEHLEREKQN